MSALDSLSDTRPPGRELPYNKVMQESTFKVGDIINGYDGDELIVQIDSKGKIYTLVLTQDGNSYTQKQLTKLQ